ncbi:reverse transcriptase domain-containing protein [Tanacetum coccineum]
MRIARPLSIWKELNLPALTKTRMILELADRTISIPTGIAEDVFVKVRTFFFPAGFVVVDYIADPQVSLILGRPFLRTARTLIDVHGKQMTLRYNNQSVTFKVGDTKTFSYNIIDSVNQVDVINIACEEYVQEVLEISKSGNPTSTLDLTIDSRSPSFTPFGGSDFLMEEIDEFLKHDDSIPPGVDGIYDSEGDTVYLEELLSVINSDPNLPPSPVCEINVPEKVKSSCEDPLDLELKDLPCSSFKFLAIMTVLEISESGNPTSPSELMIDSRSPSFTPFEGSVDGIYDSEGDTVYLEQLLSVINSDPNLPPSPVCEINVPEKIKSSCEDPPDLELKDLPSHLKVRFVKSSTLIGSLKLRGYVAGRKAQGDVDFTLKALT